MQKSQKNLIAENELQKRLWLTALLCFRNHFSLGIIFYQIDKLKYLCCANNFKSLCENVCCLCIFFSLCIANITSIKHLKQSYIDAIDLYCGKKYLDCNGGHKYIADIIYIYYTCQCISYVIMESTY